jgi:urease accessory protein
VSGYSDGELQRAQGSCRVVLDRGERGNRIVDVFQQHPMRIMFPRICGANLEEAVIVNASGGVAGGDRLETDVTLVGDASLAVTTQAAEKVYRALSEPAHVITRLNVGAAARLAWLPQETIVFQQAQLRRETQIQLVSGAQMLALEWLVFGRAAHGEELHSGCINDSWRVSIDGRLVWADSFRVTDDVFPHLRGKAALSDAKAIATMVCFAPHPESQLETLRSISSRIACEFGATSVGGLVIARFAASRSSDLRSALQIFLQQASGRSPFRVPKMWSC